LLFFYDLLFIYDLLKRKSKYVLFLLYMFQLPQEEQEMTDIM
jgi:hypothetical protein